MHDASLFEGTAEYYAKFRLPYPNSMLDMIAEHNTTHELSRRALDLGCGTGLVAVPLAKRGLNVFAVDPDIDMIHEGMLFAKNQGVASIRWLIGADLDLPRMNLPKIQTCTMGASFHWMNQSFVLNELDRLILPTGSVCILSGRFDDTHEETRAWNQIVKTTIKEFLGPKRRAGKGTYERPYRHYSELLGESMFSNVLQADFTCELKLSIDQVIGLQLSMSFASPRLLGDRIEDFKETIRRRLERIATNQKLVSRQTFQLVLGKRGNKCG